MSLETFLHSFNILHQEDILHLRKIAKTKTLQKGALFIREGQICREVAFVNTGCFRSYYYNSTSEEVTYCFTFDNYFLTAYSSFISGEACVENIEVLSDAQILSFTREQIKSLESTNHRWLAFFKVLAEQEYIRMEKRILLLQRESAEKRYLDLLNNHPNYLKEIPLQYLASYLGITQRHLSRIRKETRF